MIPGDIDLTENLDFRNVVKRETPQLPSVWNKSNIVFKSSDRITITNSTITSVSYFNIIDDEILDVPYDIYDNSLDNVYARTIITTNSSVNTYISYADEISTITSTYSYSSGRFKLNTKECEYDVFGNLKRSTVVDTPTIPWNKKHVFVDKTIPWNKFRSQNFLYTERIPWDYTMYISEYLSEPNLSSLYDRASNLISWLSKKTRTFITNYLRYLEKEEVNLSYLTNMSWIGVKDAIID